VGFKYRSKRPGKAWRDFWDWALFVGGFAPALVFGVAVGNVLRGLPFRLDGDLRTHYEGGFFGLFTPFTLLCGLLSVAMLVTHAAAWLSVKAERGAVSDRARNIGTVAAVLASTLFAFGYVFVLLGHMGFRIDGVADLAGPSNPPATQTVAAAGGWLLNFAAHPWMWIAPILGLVGPWIALTGLRLRREWAAFAGSSLAIVGIISTVGLSMFPFILPSSIDPRSSLMVWNASSSQLTLFIMLCVTVVFLPIVLAYTSWAFKVMWGRSTVAALAVNPDLY
jgi:cytochrome d ubiquinol oxidase subunit II